MKNVCKIKTKVVEYFNKLWYDLSIRVKSFGGVKMKKEEVIGILDVEDFACYIKTRYNKKNGKDISPIKLQKSLYFCFAYWGGFVNKSKNTEEEINESSYLFETTFKAWSYGPVIPDIYHKEQLGLLNKEINEEIFNGNTIVEETINSLLDDLFEISDFKLVNISHADKCWQNNFDAEAKKHDKKIDCKEIIREYTYKY